jgi:hypothetical protein
LFDRWLYERERPSPCLKERKPVARNRSHADVRTCRGDSAKGLMSSSNGGHPLHPGPGGEDFTRVKRNRRLVTRRLSR